MKLYWKMLRRLISHPKTWLDIARKFVNNHIFKWKRYCLKCWCVWWQHKHKKSFSWVILYKCIHCNQTYSEFYWTIFFWTKTPINKWMIAILEWCISTWSISAAELARRIEVKSDTAWNMLMKIRKLIYESNINSSKLLSWIVEADEAWYWKKKNNNQDGNQDIVMWLVERWKNWIRWWLRLFPIPNVKEKTLYPIIKSNVEKWSYFYTDSRLTYHITCIHYKHWVTNHSKWEFANWEVHSNTIEQIWWDIKWIIRTVHHWVSKKYRLFYLAQYTAKYENIKSNDLFFFTLSKILIPTFRGC